MSGEVRVDDHFLSERLGDALAKLWTVNGLTLELVDMEYNCVFTAERPANPGMTEDGHVYSMANITRWLTDKDTSPNTNSILTHKRVMHLLPLKKTIEQFFTKCRVDGPAARVQIEANCSRACAEATRYNQMKVEVEQTECYINACMNELEAWNRHLDVVRGIQNVLKERMLEDQRMAATQIQTRWRSFIAKRWRRLAATERFQNAISCMTSAVRAFIARSHLLRLVEERSKTNVQLLKALKDQVGNVCILVSAFLQGGADVNYADADGSTPLIVAAIHGNVEIVKLLCDAGAKREKSDQAGYTALMHSSDHGYEQCQALIEAKANIEAEQRQGCTALLLTCENGHGQCTSALIEAKADIDKPGPGGFTALMFSAANGHEHCAWALIDAKVYLEATQINGFTALMLSCEKGHCQCTQALIEANANFEAAVASGHTSLMYACQNGNEQCAHALIEAKADLGKQAVNGFSALILSAQKGHDQCARALIEARADPEQQTTKGSTALMLSSKKGHDLCVQALTKAGATR